jgi:hypothetical protein
MGEFFGYGNPTAPVMAETFLCSQQGGKTVRASHELFFYVMSKREQDAGISVTPQLSIMNDLTVA